jgi:hypothetical protein
MNADNAVSGVEIGMAMPFVPVAGFSSVFIRVYLWLDWLLGLLLSAFIGG